MKKWVKVKKCPNCGGELILSEFYTYPPSAAGGKPCCFCDPTDPLLNCYQRKDDDIDV